jgi:hypothetical protein
LRMETPGQVLQLVDSRSFASWLGQVR